MQFLKTVFWVFVAVIIAIVARNNWTPVKLKLWDNLELVTQLPVLLGIAFLVGLLPTFLIHRATRWQMRRKLDSAKRELETARMATPAAPQAHSSLPPAAAPIAVPPGVA